MAIRPNSEERSFGADRERQREVSNESGRSARSSSGENVGRTDNTSESGSAQRTRSNRGFASMDRSKQREIASKGGRAAHQKGTAHEFDSGEARAAGRKGGVTVSRNREHMAAIGRRGGEARGANRAARMQQSSDNGVNASQSGSSSASSPRIQGDREVGLATGVNGAPTPSSNTAGQGTSRQSGNSLGGERATGSASAERNVERP
jgi:general stress protein YciG